MSENDEGFCLILSVDEKGNATLREPSPTVSFELSEDEIIALLVAIWKGEPVTEIVAGKPISYENVKDPEGLFERIKAACEEVD